MIGKIKHMLRCVAALLGLMMLPGLVLFGIGAYNRLNWEPRLMKERDQAMETYRQYEAEIDAAISAGRLSKLRKLEGAEGLCSVYVKRNSYAYFCCGGGIAPSSHDYGFFYSAKDELDTAYWGGSIPDEQLVPYKNGYLHEQNKYNKNGGNWYYVEKLDEHIYFYSGSY